MDENNEAVQEEIVFSEADLKAMEDGWADENEFYEAEEGSEANDEPVDDSEPDQDEGGDLEPDTDNDEPDEEPDEAEEPGAETETANQRFKIKYNGAEEEYDLDQMTVLAQKGRNYDHVVEERDNLRGQARNAERQLGFLKDLADRAGLSVDEQIDRTRALWLMNDEFDKGNEISETDALLMVQRNKNNAIEQQAEEQQNDTNREIDRFLAIYPGTKYEDIPQDVWDMYNRTGDLLGSYQAWEIKQLRAENEKIKKEAHNERNAQRSTGPLKTSGAKRKRSVIDDAWYTED